MKFRYTRAGEFRDTLWFFMFYRRGGRKSGRGGDRRSNLLKVSVKPNHQDSDYDKEDKF